MEINIDGLMYEEVENKGNYHCEGCVAVGDFALCDMLSLSTGSTCCSGSEVSVIWKIKEVKEPIKPKEKEPIMQKKEIDKSKKYKTVKGSDVELVYENYRYGEEYLWVVSPKDSPKFPIATNKYGESIMPEDFNLVEFNPLEELIKMPVDTLVKVTQKPTGVEYFRYLHSVSPCMSEAILFDEGATSRTTTRKSAYPSKFWTFEIIE